MRKTCRLLITGLLLLLGACASSDWPNLLLRSPEDAYRLADEHHYKKAIELAGQRVDGARDETLRAQWQVAARNINERAQAFAKQQGDQVDTLLAQGKWRAALPKIAFLEQNLPAPIVATRLEQWRARQSEEQGAARDRWYLLRSRQLPEEIALLQQQLALSPGSRELKTRLRKLEREAGDVYQGLADGFARAQESGASDSALLYARGMLRLRPSERVEAEIDRLRARQAAAAEAGRARPANASLQKDYDRLLNEYGAALLSEQWLQARAVLNRLLAMRPREPELLGQDKHLKEIFAREIEAGRREGERLYSAGEVEEALAAWRAAQQLAGDDPALRANIERAQRILDKVKALTGDAAGQGETAAD